MANSTRAWDFTHSTKSVKLQFTISQGNIFWMDPGPVWDTTNDAAL